MTLKLTPVCGPIYEAAAWAPAGDTWVALTGSASDDDVVRFVAEVARYGRVLDCSSLDAAIVSIAACQHSLVVGGGLRVSQGALRIDPSCCAGLEGWREWLTAACDKHSPWMGHDPSPWVAFESSHVVIHTDETNQHSACAPPIMASYDELETALAEAKADLAGFYLKLGALASKMPRSVGAAFLSVLQSSFFAHT